MPIQTNTSLRAANQSILDAIRYTTCHAELRRLRDGERLHVSEGSSLLFVCDGQCEVEIAGRPSLFADTVIFQSNHDGNEFVVHGRGTGWLLVVQLINFPIGLRLLRDHDSDSLIVDTAQHEPVAQIGTLLRSFVSQAFESSIRGKVIDRIAESLLLQTLMFLRSGVDVEMGRPIESNLSSDKDLLKVVRTLRSDPARPWTLAMMARLAGLSRSTFSQRFRELTGVSPVQHLISIRMELARHLLSTTSLGIAEIGLQVGYETSSAFSRSFKKATQTSPVDYRSECSSVAVRSADKAE